MITAVYKLMPVLTVYPIILCILLLVVYINQRFIRFALFSS